MFANLIISFQLFLLIEYSPATALYTFVDSRDYGFTHTGPDITCPADDDCLVLCTGQYSCQYSTILCPEYHTCDIRCDRHNSCAYVCVYIYLFTHYIIILIYAVNIQADITWPFITGYGTLTCIDDNWSGSCAYTNFPDKPNATIDPWWVWEGPENVKGAKMYCPESASCSIACIQYESCADVCIYYVIPYKSLYKKLKMCIQNIFIFRLKYIVLKVKTAIFNVLVLLQVEEVQLTVIHVII